MREENFLDFKKGDGTPSGNPVSISIGSQEKFSTLGQAAGQQGERPPATSLLKQCATRLRGIVEALDNIHDSTPHRWSTDLDDVHSSAESLLALINDQAPTQAAQGLAGAALAQSSPALPPFAEKVLAKLRRFYDCASDFESGGVDIGRHWLDLLTQLGLLNRVQRSPALWEISQQGEDLLGMPQPSPAQAEAERPEMSPERAAYFMRRFKSEEKLLGPNEQAAVDYVLSLLAQHERIAGALREENANLILACASLDSEKREMQHKWDAIIAMRDAALANVDALAVQVLKLGGTISFAHHRTDQAGQVPQAWLDVQAERRRQITAEGWTPEHDDEHSHGQMARAAACYALAGSSDPNDRTAALLVSLAWPWDQQWWKPTSARRDLVKACALALAEIERLDRAGISQSPQPGATTASS